MQLADGSFLHILRNGAWINSVAQLSGEPKAPTGNDLQVNGSSVEVGPFNTAGTYPIHCTIHQGMNLAVVGQ